MSLNSLIAESLFYFNFESGVPTSTASGVPITQPNAPISTVADATHGLVLNVDDVKSLEFAVAHPSNYSKAFWIKPNPDPVGQEGRQRHFFGSADGIYSGGSHTAQVRYDGFQKLIVLTHEPASGSGSILIAPVDTVPLNTWSHVVVTYSAATAIAQCYVNGVLVQEQGGMTPIISNVMNIGSYLGFYFLDGKLDNVGFWSKVLTSEEVNLLYTAPNNAPIGSNNNVGSVSVTGSPVRGNTLTANVIDVDGLSGVNISYQWQQSTNGSQWTNISSAIANALALTQTHVGKFIRVTASYTDQLGNAESLTSASTSVVTAPPNNLGSVVITGVPATNNVLTATVNDADGLPGSISYQWQQSSNVGVSWSNIAGATTSTLSITNAYISQVLRVTVAYTDVLGNSETLTSASTSAVIDSNPVVVQPDPSQVFTGLVADLLKLEQDTKVELFTLDLTPIGINLKYYFCSDSYSDGIPIAWQGHLFEPHPIIVSGYDRNNKGQLASPKITASNVGGILTAILQTPGGIEGSNVIRQRTYAKYLDGQPLANPQMEFGRQVHRINRIEGEDDLQVSIEMQDLASAGNKKIPGRTIKKNTCGWKYRGADCGYSGAPVADLNDNPTTNPLLDDCGKRLGSCSLRFGNQPLPFEGFPGVDA